MAAATLLFPQSLRAQESCCVPAGTYKAGELLVHFTPGISDETVEGIARLAGARVIRRIYAGPSYLMQVPMGEELAYIAVFDAFGAVRYSEPNHPGCIYLPPCTCCPCGYFCPTMPHCPGACAGAVPDGINVPGDPLTIHHEPGGAIRLEWGASCFASDADYAVYESPMGSSQYVPTTCSTGGETTLTLTPSSGSVNYIVVPISAQGEGSYGMDSLRLQRPGSTSRCYPQALAVKSGCTVLCGDEFQRGDEACDGQDLGGGTCTSLGFDGGTLACSPTCEFNTTGCTSVCGDGVRRGNEQCDGEDLGSDTCQTAGFDAGIMGCLPSCLFDTTGCTTVCGDGVRRGNEVCDGGDFGGVSCLTQGFDGGTLTCAASCDSFSTAGCTICGDGIRQPNEQCDGADLNGQTCTSFGFTGGTLTCRPECAFSFGSCSFCGNNAREGAEVCDGNDLAGQTCASQGFTGGSLGCNASCSDFNRSACTRCGNGVREAGETCDGADLAGKSCESLGFSGGTLTCNASCLSLDTSLCFN